MDRGFYVSVSGMMCGSKKLNDISNNVANISTVGYKRDVSNIEEFSDIMITKLNENIDVGMLTNQVNIEDRYTRYNQGSLVQTKLETDYAIEGDGFFKIEKNGKYVYTRDGSFSYDTNGYLLTNDGGFVIGKDNQRVKYQPGVDQSEQLLIVNFEDKATLNKTDKNYFINEFGRSEEAVYTESKVRQGYLEMSNVDAADEIADLIKVQRYYQLNQSSLKTHDELLEKICNFSR